ncbi:MAG: hypothetical protein JNN00_16110 [Chitinophagaceae bacterium]|nr:hypothetical protein [Chitinophagaceae bacterium]
MKFTGLIIVVAVLFAACDRKPFVEHKLKFEKMNGSCEKISPSFRMTSNFGGERFEFEKCLPADFTKEQMTASRQGDTVLIQFKQPAPGKSGDAYAITLDIDSYPKYNYITIDNDTYAIIPSN